MTLKFKDVEMDKLTAKIYKDTITVQLPKSIKFEDYFKNKKRSHRYFILDLTLELSTNNCSRLTST